MAASMSYAATVVALFAFRYKNRPKLVEVCYGVQSELSTSRGFYEWRHRFFALSSSRQKHVWLHRPLPPKRPSAHAELSAKQLPTCLCTTRTRFPFRHFERWHSNSGPSLLDCPSQFGKRTPRSALRRGHHSGRHKA